MWEIGLWSVLLLKSFNAFELDFGAFFGQGLLRNPSQIRFSICAILIKKALFTHVVAAGQLYRRRSRRRAPKAASAKRKYESPLFAMVKPFSSILELVVNYWRAKQKIPGILEIGKFFSINGLLQYTYQPATKSNTFGGA